MTAPPTPQAAWAAARADGIGVDAAERLRDGQAVQIMWTPPVPILHRASAMPANLTECRTFVFRLHCEPDGWWVEGNDGGPWVQCEGPIVDCGRPPYLARPKVLP
jgi:hypothetical protein